MNSAFDMEFDMKRDEPLLRVCIMHLLRKVLSWKLGMKFMDMGKVI